METNLIKVYDATLLSSLKVYQINGTLCRYLGDTGTIQHPQFLFSPLPNQKKKASFRLNRNKLMTRCYDGSKTPEPTLASRLSARTFGDIFKRELSTRISHNQN